MSRSRNSRRGRKSLNGSGVRAERFEGIRVRNKKRARGDKRTERKDTDYA